MIIIQPLDDIYLYKKDCKEDWLTIKIPVWDIIIATDTRWIWPIKEYKICIWWINARHFQELDKTEYIKQMGYDKLYKLIKNQ